MAMKKGKVSTRKPVENDNTITKAIYGMAIFCIMFCGLNILRPHLVINDNLSLVIVLMRVSMVTCIVVAVASIVAWICLRKSKPILHYPLVALTVLMIVAAVTFKVLLDTWATYTASSFYIAYVGLLVLYLIYLIYPTEFLLISCANAMAALAFYGISKKGDLVLLSILLVVVVIVTNGLIYVGSKNKGKIGKWKIFNGSFVSMIAHCNGALLVICLIGSLVLGSLFAYYCMFAVGAVQLALAVYYTVKLA